MNASSGEDRAYDGSVRIGNGERPIRSVLFLPADDLQRLQAAGASEADAIVADMEDMTPENRKRQARRYVEEWCQGPAGSFARMVRINGEGSAWVADDLAMLRDLALDAVVVPKASVKAIDRVAALNFPIVAVLESADAVRNAYSISSRESVVAMALGVRDLAHDLNAVSGIPEQLLLYLRSTVLIDVRAAGMCGLFDGPTRMEGVASLAAECGLLRSMGFSGKVTTRPEEVPVINSAWEDG